MILSGNCRLYEIVLLSSPLCSLSVLSARQLDFYVIVLWLQAVRDSSAPFVRINHSQTALLCNPLQAVRDSSARAACPSHGLGLQVAIIHFLMAWKFFVSFILCKNKRKHLACISRNWPSGGYHPFSNSLGILCFFLFLQKQRWLSIFLLPKHSLFCFFCTKAY